MNTLNLLPFYSIDGHLSSLNIDIVNADKKLIHENKQHHIQSFQHKWPAIINEIQHSIPQTKILDQTSILENCYAFSVTLAVDKYDKCTLQEYIMFEISWLYPFFTYYYQAAVSYTDSIRLQKRFFRSEKDFLIQSDNHAIIAKIESIISKTCDASFIHGLSLEKKMAVNISTGQVEIKTLYDLLFH